MAHRNRTRNYTYFVRGWETEGSDTNGCRGVKSIYRCYKSPHGIATWKYYDWSALRWMSTGEPDDQVLITREEIIAMHPKNKRCVWPGLLKGY